MPASIYSDTLERKALDDQQRQAVLDYKTRLIDTFALLEESPDEALAWRNDIIQLLKAGAELLRRLQAYQTKEVETYLADFESLLEKPLEDMILGEVKAHRAKKSALSKDLIASTAP